MKCIPAHCGICVLDSFVGFIVGLWVWFLFVLCGFCAAVRSVCYVSGFVYSRG